MTCVCVAEAARQLGIDVKTLRRWLCDAQLPLQSHPHDGRKKGVSQQHLHLLARLHQRSLSSLPETPSVAVDSEELLLPAQFQDLPAQLSALQTQIAALQRDVADLSRLLQQHESASKAASSQRTGASRGPSKPAPPASRSRATVKAPRKPVHVIPRVEYGEQGHYVVICPRRGVLPFEPDTEEWFAWVAEQDSFRFVGKRGHFTAHHEWRVPKGAWRAHRHIRHHVHALRLAPNQELTLAVLERAAEALQARLV